jgi:hypothetical protein
MHISLLGPVNEMPSAQLLQDYIPKECKGHPSNLAELQVFWLELLESANSGTEHALIRVIYSADIYNKIECSEKPGLTSHHQKPKPTSLLSPTD